MTNKEKFLKLTSPLSEESSEFLRFMSKNRHWLRESQRIATDVLFALKEKGLSQKDLAEMLNVSPQYISKLVKGKENLTLDTITKLQKHLGLRILASSVDRHKTENAPVTFVAYKTTYEKRYSTYSTASKIVKISG